MRRIDGLAYANELARLHPAYKAGCSLLGMLAALLMSRIDVSIAVVAIMLTLSIAWARLPAPFVLRLVAGEASFLLITAAGVALSISAAPLPGGLNVGPLWFGTCDASLMVAAGLLARALACAVAMNFLALTTPMTAIVDLLRSLRVSDVLIDVMTLVYRFVFVLLDTLDRMLLAHEARLGFVDWRSTLESSGRIGASLFVESYRRSRNLEAALSARAWGGTLRVLPGRYEHPWWAGRLVGRLAR